MAIRVDEPSTGEQLGRTLSEALPKPGWWLVLVTGLIALVIAVSAVVMHRGGRWRRAIASAHVFSTIVHEAGHALGALITGGGVWTIEVDSPHTGVTHTWYTSRFSRIICSLAGYAAPPLAGLALAGLLAQGRVPAALTFTTAAMALVLLVSRDLITMFSVTAVGALTFAALYWGGPLLQQAFAYTQTWLLLLCESAGVWALVRSRWHGVIDSHDDAAALADQTGIPDPIWILAWYALIGWCLCTAAPLLWP